jgi:hypothetical protein
VPSTIAEKLTVFIGLLGAVVVSMLHWVSLGTLR